MLKKLENSEVQSISSIFPMEDAICLKHFQLLHLGGTPLICTQMISKESYGSISPAHALRETRTPSFFSLKYVVSEMRVVATCLCRGNLTRYLYSSISLSCHCHFLSNRAYKFPTISSGSISPSSMVRTTQLSKNLRKPDLFSSSCTSTWKNSSP
jgi:hypothetical protein